MFSKSIKKKTMAEQMAEAVQQAILSGELESGTLLPTEPELAEQFGVSRAVVRDATRILMARGLVEVQHGRGVFVTEPDNEAFGQALLLALRRVGASAWDVEQFEQILFPELIALAATSATETEISHIQQLAEQYIAAITDHHTQWWQQDPPAIELERLTAAYRQFMQAIFAASHNRLIQQLAQPLLQLRNLRNWADSEEISLDSEEIVAVETRYIRRLIEAIAGRNPVTARKIISRLMELPPEAIEAMRQTPVGEITIIPIPLPRQDL
jgi:GntR family transcriptional repressor for pyruvate dehydrogenase complex